MDIGIYGRPEYYFQYDSSEFQAVIEALNIESNPQERSNLLKKAQQLISEDYVNGYLFEKITSFLGVTFNIESFYNRLKFGTIILKIIFWPSVNPDIHRLCMANNR